MMDKTPPQPRTKRPWREKFRCAFRGIKLGIRGQSSFSAHFFVSALVLASALVMRCEILEWAVLLGCIGAVLTVELLNSCVEKIYARLPEEIRQGDFQVLDIAAGAVLLASIFAGIIGAVIFLPKAIALFAR